MYHNNLTIYEAAKHTGNALLGIILMCYYSESTFTSTSGTQLNEEDASFPARKRSMPFQTCLLSFPTCLLPFPTCLLSFPTCLLCIPCIRGVWHGCPMYTCGMTWVSRAYEGYGMGNPCIHGVTQVSCACEGYDMDVLCIGGACHGCPVITRGMA